MHKLFKSTVLMLALFVPLCMASGAHAQFYMGGGGHGDGDRSEMREKREKMIQEVYDQLDLNDEQKRSLQDNKNRHKAATESLSQNLKASMQSFGDELKKKDLDLTKINGLHAELKNTRNAMADERLNAILEVRQILTVEQFTKFLDLVRQQKEKENK